MYAQVEKSKEDKKRAVANSVARKREYALKKGFDREDVKRGRVPLKNYRAKQLQPKNGPPEIDEPKTTKRVKRERDFPYDQTELIIGKNEIKFNVLNATVKKGIDGSTVRSECSFNACTNEGRAHQAVNEIPAGENILDFIEQAQWYKHKSGLIWAKYGSDYIQFDTDNMTAIEQLVSDLKHIYLTEPQPRSGLGRAAPDSMEGKNREPANEEAPYATKKGVYQNKETGPEFKAWRTSGKIIAEITHTGPWAKGLRVPSQFEVMGRQNAKNYIIDALNGDKAEGETPVTTKSVGGRWEWLHLIGSSLGGYNTINNLVAGSYDANTKMIPLEHRVANWGVETSKSQFKPSKETPIKIRSEAVVVPDNTYVAKTITMTVQRGTSTIASGTYNADSQLVITKKGYKKEEERVNREIEGAKAKDKESKQQKKEDEEDTAESV